MRIREIATHDDCDLDLTNHAKERMKERGILAGDAHHVLRHGFVHESGVESSRSGFYKYAIECRSPNSNSRQIRLIVIPSPSSPRVKIVTVMWVN